MPKKRPKLVTVAERLVVARRIVAKQSALVTKLRANGKPTLEAEGTLQTYRSSLHHLESHARNMRADAKVKRAKR
jgi:hypothetical protein